MIDKRRPSDAMGNSPTGHFLVVAADVMGIFFDRADANAMGTSTMVDTITSLARSGKISLI